MADIYEKGISTAGMSKAYSLAGLRLGWITAPDNFIEDVICTRNMKIYIHSSSLHETYKNK